MNKLGFMKFFSIKPKNLTLPSSCPSHIIIFVSLGRAEMSNRGNIRRRGRGPRGAGRGRGGRILTTTQERSDPELLEIEKKVNQTFNEAHHKLKNISSIIDAVRKDDFPRFQSLVNQAQTYINELSINGDSILVEACRFGRAEMFDFLMNQTKININLASQNKKQQRFLTPLMAAIMTLDISFVKKLLYESNREVDVAKVCGQPLQANAPMLCVIYSVCNGYKQEHASKALEILEILLEYAKKKEKLKDLFNKSLFFHDSKLVHAAAMASNFEALSLLRRYGARLDIYNQRGLTPINLAESNVLQKRNFLLRPMKKQKKKQNKGKKHNQNKNKNKSNTTTDRDIKETIENQKEEVEEEEIEGLAGK
jgi:ankyrin repeat protein